MENRFSQFIVDHTKYLVYQMRTVIEILLKPEGAKGLGRFKLDDTVLVGDDLERFAPQWAYLVPDDPTTCAIIAHDFITTYELVYERAIQLRSALYLDTEAVQQAYEERYGETIEAAMSDQQQTLPRRVTRLSWVDEMTAYKIERQLEWVDLKAGERLFATDALYVVVSGQVQVSDEAKESIPGRGAIIGDASFLEAKDKLRSIAAARHSQLVKFTRSAFYQLNSQFPQIMLTLVRKIINLPLPTPLMRAVAILPLHDSEAIDQFKSYLKAELGAMGNVLHLSAVQLDEQLYVGASQALGNKPLMGPVISWLREQETLHDLVVYDVSSDNQAWARQSVQNVDKILLVAEVNHPYDVTDVEKSLQLPASTDLILLHPNKKTLPSGTRHWLERRKLDAHHHIAMNNPNDTRRLARRLMGRSIGLVLGAGVTRAYAYCGVIRALNEPGIALDSVAATSFGCIPAAMLAMNEDSQQSMAALERLLGSLAKRTLPVTSLISGKQISKTLRDIFGDTRLEDLWVPLTCVSFDATHAIVHLHQRGLLRDALRASLSLPGLFPAVALDKEMLLIDGSIVNPLPVDVVRRAIDGAVIAVDAGKLEIVHPAFDFKNDVSGWQLLWNRFNPLGGDKIEAPDIVELMSRMVMVVGHGQIKQQLAKADMPVALPLEGFGLFENARSQELEQIGYRTTRDVVAKWLAEHPEFEGVVNR
ncbi:MAG: patatin-like phospholipase family protein [Chloroflexi bacterium]|nr:patatin-like phospholipase family protein [Chloroflexota bacterium]